MNYRIKNIAYWLQFCPHNQEIKHWKNDECHTMEGETEQEAVNFNVADVSQDISMEQEAERAEQKPEIKESPVTEEVKEAFVCECGKVCKSKAKDNTA